MAINWLLDEVMVPFIRQRHRKECGIACLLMILKFYKHPISYEELCCIVRMDRKKGVSLLEMVKTMESFGFEVMAVKGERADFFSDYPLPCIAVVQFQTGFMHYVVVCERSKEKIVIADPAIGIVTLKPEQFLDGEKRKWFLAKYRWTGILVLVKNLSDHMSNMRK